MLMDYFSWYADRSCPETPEEILGHTGDIIRNTNSYEMEEGPLCITVEGKKWAETKVKRRLGQNMCDT